ncbi:ATP synthase subunit I [Thermosynechococcaceae cyanobacterium BACA0444]|uniref:ATP synthase subunit I n=1 Tax=Pseudocalidococcus azoricus BACA0444 TaxID=2918990 RepID=A0AAE4FVX9_9CYAN|nr:ATP synthase subunit I [Pseudocalidococcus azoricus]MDS3862299.1 ATP synthase subunit I [Pseudocalidococcus azoricus BACA0444]
MSDPTPNPEENSPIANFAALDSPREDISGSDSMQEFYQLRQELLLTSVVLMLIVFPAVWFFYSFNTALNYIVGAITALIYLRLLANNVEQLGRGKTKVGKSQLLVLVVVLVIATRWQQLHILPVFLGFLTYKAAILVYMFRTVILPPQTGQ